MALDQKISALTGTLRSEFWKAWNETAEPAPHEKFTTIIPSTTRIEHYVNGTPVPAMSEWQGFRNYGRADTFVYSIKNLTYHNGFMAFLEDVEDDQIGFLKSKPKELVVRAKKFPGRAVIKTLSLGTTGLGFDGTAFFANSHSFGTGDNLLAFTTLDSSSGSATAATTYKIAALYHGDSVLKPMIWQNRSGPEFQTNSGSPQSKESRQLRWWCDLRGASAYGYWWSAVLVQALGQPSVTEMHTIYRDIETAFRTFQLPKTISTEDGEYVHEQTLFSESNMCLVGPPALGHLFRQSLNQEWVPQSVPVTSATNTVATTNLFKGFASYIVSAFMN